MSDMDIKKIRYKVSSSRTTTPSTILCKYKSLCIYDYDSFWQCIQIDILGNIKEGDFDDFDDINLGFIEGTYLKIEDMEIEDVDKFDVFDSISQEIQDFYSDLFDEDGMTKHKIIGINGNVFLLIGFILKMNIEI